MSDLRSPVVPTAIHLADIPAGIGRASELLEASRQAHRRPDNVLGLLVRAVSREEIAIMEGRGCRADDWACIIVAEDFDAFRVRRTHLIGACVLGRFCGEVEVMPGISLPTGIYDCTLIDSQVGNDCLLENVRFAARTICEHGSVLFDVGSITCNGDARYGCDTVVSLGCEAGGREVPFWPEIGVTEAALIAGAREDHAGQAAIMAAHAEFLRQVTASVTWVRRGARIRHTKRIRNAFIGSGAIVDQAMELDNCTVYSLPDEPASITGGASLRDSIVAPGCSVSGGAIVRHSALCEYATVDENAVVARSLLGPNTVMAKGEITASLVGPFVALHHQSLLIAARWPDGKGNVAYGAMVGSNHTGRAPDQEIHVGEGIFFGLGCSIKFPTDFTDAPYTVIAAGTSTLAQRVRFPFSLITMPVEPLDESAGGIPRAFNEILPAWGLFANAYAIVRAERKFRDRDRARRTTMTYQVLSPAVMRQVHTARELLQRVDQEDTARRTTTHGTTLYTEADIPGLGKNFLREDVRLQAIDAYGQALRRYALRVLLADAEGHSQPEHAVDLARELADTLLPDLDGAARLRELILIERQNAEIVEASRKTDDHRGQRIIPGYAATHVVAAEDPVVCSAWDRVRSTEERVRRVLGHCAD